MDIRRPRAWMLAITAVTLTTGCSGSEPATSPSPAASPTPRFETRSSMPAITNPDKRRAVNQVIMDHMMTDMRIPSDEIPGEARRRGIVIDPAALQARIERERQAARP